MTPCLTYFHCWELNRIIPLSQELLSRITTANNSSAPINDFIDDWIPEPFSLSPWATWTLFSLIKHRRRQEFVAEIVKNRLGVKLEDLARSGYGAHPKDKGSGLVPGLADWEYDLHGRGCCVKHRVTGEEIDVDFLENTADWFDPFFYRLYFISLRPNEVWEKRVVDLHPTFNMDLMKFDTIALDFNELEQAGLLEQHSEDHVVRLAFDDQDLFEQMTQFETSPYLSERLIRLAAVVGDWPLVKELLGPDQVTPIIEEATVQVIAKREQKLAKLFHEGSNQELALKAIQENHSPDLDYYIRQTLNNDDYSTVLTAMEMIAETNDPAWCPLIYDFYKRNISANESAHPFSWIECLEYLLRHNYRFEEMVQHLSSPQGESPEAALLALEFNPQYALDLFRRTLRSTIPANRDLAAAMLAILDQPWSRRELLRVLAESTEQDLTVECRAALQQLQRKDTQQLVKEWEELNPHDPEKGDWVSFDEMLLQKAPGLVKWHMKEWHDRVFPLRNTKVSESD